jgi:hypothetical protein
VKRRLAWAWTVLIGLAILAVIVLTPFQPWTWHTLESSGRAIVAGVAVMTPSVQYLRRTPADRRKIRELRDTDRKLDAIEREISHE